MILFIVWLWLIGGLGGIHPLPQPPVGDDPPPKIVDLSGDFRDGKASFVSNYSPVVDTQD